MKSTHLRRGSVLALPLAATLLFAACGTGESTATDTTADPGVEAVSSEEVTESTGTDTTAGDGDSAAAADYLGSYSLADEEFGTMVTVTVDGVVHLRLIVAADPGEPVPETFTIGYDGIPARDDTHEIYVTVAGSSDFAGLAGVIDSDTAELTVGADSSSGVGTTFTSMVSRGFDHVLDGTDHLLVLLVLLGPPAADGSLTSRASLPPEHMSMRSAMDAVDHPSIDRPPSNPTVRQMPTYRPDSPVPGGMTIIWLEPATGVEAGNEHRARILRRGVWKDPQMKLSRLINPTRGEPAARLFEEV